MSTLRLVYLYYVLSNVVCDVSRSPWGLVGSLEGLSTALSPSLTFLLILPFSLSIPLSCLFRPSSPSATLPFIRAGPSPGGKCVRENRLGGWTRRRRGGPRRRGRREVSEARQASHNSGDSATAGAAALSSCPNCSPGAEGARSLRSRSRPQGPAAALFSPCVCRGKGAPAGPAARFPPNVF